MKSNASKLTITAMFIAMITIMIAYIGHIPYGAHGGYIHFGDSLIYLAAVFLPRPYALVAAAMGGGLADLLTAPLWVPATMIIKMLITLFFTSKEGRILGRRNMVAPFLAAIVSISGYYLAEGLMFGSFVAAFGSALGNVIQGVGSAAIFFVLSGVMDKARLKSRAQKFLHTYE